MASCKGGGKETPGAKPAAGKPGAGRGPSALEAVIAKAFPIEEVVRVPGSLGPARQVELKTEMGGRIAELGFKEGSTVQKGAVLLRLADEDLAATAAKSQAKVKLARLTLDRKRQQQAADGASLQEVDAAEADLASNEADLALANAQLRKSRVVAPFAGVVGIRSVEPGQTVVSGQTVVTLLQRSPWRIVFAIPEEQSGSARPGQNLTFRSGGSDSAFPARLVALDPVLDPATRTRRAVAESRAESPMLFPGRIVDVSLPLDKSDGISIPTEALGFDAKGPLVWIYKGGKSVQTRIVTGLRTTDLIEAKSGLRPGDTVLVAGAATLKPDGEVKIARIRGAK